VSVGKRFGAAALVAVLDRDDGGRDPPNRYVQVTVYRDKLRIKQPTRCIKYQKFILS
jgi:hypothetical protein